MSTIPLQPATSPVEWSARSAEQQESSARTRREHSELLAAMHRLEAALASPAPTREMQWKSRAAQDLEEVRAILEAHVLSAEGLGGLFAELEMASPHVAHRVAELRKEHSAFLEALVRLERGFSGEDATPGHELLRREAATFLSALRQHHAQEVDLIFESFWRDIGVGD
jgi:hypothetical protein